MAVAAPQQQVCPTCGQSISPALRREMEERVVAAAAELRAELEARFKAEQTTLQLQRDQAREQLEKANEEKASADRRLKEALEAERKKVEAELAKKREGERAEERIVYQNELNAQLVKAKAEDQVTLLALQKHATELERKLAEHAASKPEVIDIDLLDDLKAAFKDDRIIRLPEAEVSDLVVEVKHRSTICGRILIDSKPRAKWLAQYGNKLTDEVTEQKADCGILATQHFPKGTSQLARHGDDVLIVHPAHVIEVVGMVRHALIKMHRAKLTEEKRTEKKLELSHITSASFVRKLADIGKLAGELETIDADEKKEHDRVWKKRGMVTRKIGDLNKSLTDGLNDIVLGIEK